MSFDGLLLPQDEAVKERYGEGVATPAVLVDQTHAAQGDEHLAHMAVTESLREQSLRSLDDFLHRELAVGVVEVGNRPEQLTLAVGSTRPATSEEVAVELARNGVEGDRGGSPMRLDRLDERVVDLAADELEEVRVAARLTADRLDRVVVEDNGTLGVGDRLADRVTARLVTELVQHDHAKHPLRERSCLDKLGEQGREAG